MTDYLQMRTVTMSFFIRFAPLVQYYKVRILTIIFLLQSKLRKHKHLEFHFESHFILQIILAQKINKNKPG